MPKWEIHDKWAEKAGISKDISNFINNLIDFPTKHKEYLDFCNNEDTAHIYRKGRKTKLNISHLEKHDSGRKSRVHRENQINFINKKGTIYLFAWYLHQILDYLEYWYKNYPASINLNIEEILTEKRINKKIGSFQNQELQKIRDFIIANSEEIKLDLNR